MTRRLEPNKHVADLVIGDRNFDKLLNTAEARGYARGYAACERRYEKMRQEKANDKSNTLDTGTTEGLRVESRSTAPRAAATGGWD